MPTLLLPPRHTEDTTRLWRAAIAAGWNTERLTSLRFVPAVQERALAVYGEPFFASVVARHLGLALLEPSLAWLAELPDALRRRRVTATTLGEARKQAAPAFVKPADDKCFPAQVYACGQELPADSVLPDSIPVLVSEPVAWTIEYRCFVREGKVATLSPYLRQGRLAQTDEGAWPAFAEELARAGEFAQAVLDRVGGSLPPSVVLDVGVISGRGWAVVEANPSWGSGMYGCDPAEVLSVIARACVPMEALTEADRRFLLERVPESA